MRLNIPRLPTEDPDAACPGPLIGGQGGASEQRHRHRDSQGAIHTRSDLHRTPKDPGTGLVWHSPFGAPLTGREPLAKARANLAECLARPLTPQQPPTI